MLRKDNDSDCEKIDGLLKIVKHRYPEKFDELLMEYAQNLNKNRITARLLLEYVTVNRIEDVKEYLIDELKNSENFESKEWAFVYEIDSRIGHDPKVDSECILKLNSRSYISKEMKAYSKILLFYCYYESRNVTMLNRLSEEIEENIKEISNNFIKNSYYARFLLISISCNLHNGKLGGLLEKLLLIEDAPEALKTFIYLNAGNALMFKSYEKSMMYLNKAFECKTDKSEFEIKKSMNFVNLLWDKPENYILDQDRDISNELFYYIKVGNKKQANVILNNISMEQLSDHQLGFNYYYRGLLNNDADMFFKSIEHFNACNEKFYKQLSI
ncbi:AimR family lysis-lysogeny pheromone receptor [Heyndrickxia camelliae]|uniref:Uncharacterized protein n=1 Tax=Heyndrickxia camelliae TaxID=1707093 RepID=A0A2N3LCM0_9BACI|nr:AimR family lysis-lysogeny pheromone receptor [Heyndrickxia camelliae]PKR82402.1 hypothetical protein CWO92_24610 [Heyndrickxia camelliae]